MTVIDLGKPPVRLNYIKTPIVVDIPAVRPGWAGVWDALCSAITGKRRRSAPVPHLLNVTIIVPNNGTSIDLSTIELVEMTGEKLRQIQEFMGKL